MKLKKILENLSYQKIKGSKEVEITGICNDSKRVSPGNLFLAKRGTQFDGNQFVSAAIEAGAVAIISDLYNPFLEKKIVQVIHEDVASIESELAARYYGYPGKELFLVGVTGTNGKTTTSYLVKYLLDALEIPSGLIGTIEYILGENHISSTRTTPDSISNQKMLREMVRNGCLGASMEVSSHGLQQGRVKEIDFDIAIFTNLSQDHLDYHKTMEEYGEAKKKLFTSLKPEGVAILNRDSLFASEIKTQAKILTYGIDQKADLHASEMQLSSKGTVFTVTYKGEKETFSSSLIGKFNVYNLLAALAVGVARGVPLKELKNKSQKAFFTQIPGRLERVFSEEKKFSVFVDFAHTDYALKNVLSTLREVLKSQEGRLIAVFGCGGDRDRTKRPKMGKVCALLSDFCIVTSDNPRSENPESICHEIVKGIESLNYFVEPDRRKAIEKALFMAKKGDIVLIAGRGHEAVQIFSHHTVSFDDRKVAEELGRNLGL